MEERSAIGREGWIIFAGTGNAELGEAIARELGIALGRCTIERYPDGEAGVRIDESVRGRDVFVLQPTAPPVNDHLVELLVFADACRRADAARVTAIVPYFGYARSDKRDLRRAPVTARLVAELLETAGVARVVTIDAHTPQLEGFFRIPIENLSATPLLCEAIRSQLTDGAVIVSPDLGGAKRASDMAERLGRPVALCVKRRSSGTSVAVTQLVGEVRGRRCVIVDDMISTGGTIAECAKALVAAGAQPGPIVVATHPVLAPGAREKLRGVGVREMFFTDSIAVDAAGVPPIVRVSVAPLLAAAVRRLAAGESLRALY